MAHKNFIFYFNGIILIVNFVYPFHVMSGNVCCQFGSEINCTNMTCLWFAKKVWKTKFSTTFFERKFKIFIFTFSLMHIYYFLFEEVFIIIADFLIICTNFSRLNWIFCFLWCRRWWSENKNMDEKFQVTKKAEKLRTPNVRVRSVAILKHVRVNLNYS